MQFILTENFVPAVRTVFLGFLRALGHEVVHRAARIYDAADSPFSNHGHLWRNVDLAVRAEWDVGFIVYIFWGMMYHHDW